MLQSPTPAWWTLPTTFAAARLACENYPDLKPINFQRVAEFDGKFIPTGGLDLSFKYTDKRAHDGAH